LQQPDVALAAPQLERDTVTSWPWSRNIAAATDESTPPLIMTITVVMCAASPRLRE
jgi:hypothetical protein